jgi:hypothetical protein
MYIANNTNTLVQSLCGMLLARPWWRELRKMLKSLFQFFTIQPEKTEPEEDHFHEWQLVSKTYAKPIPPGMEVHNDQHLMEKALFGFTTCLWECGVCHKHKLDELMGTDEDSLEAYLERAGTVGPQYIKREDGDFVLAKVQPTPSQQRMINGIPLK